MILERGAFQVPSYIARNYATTMAESAVFFLVKQLSDWLIHEKNLLGGLAKEAEYIRNELEHMIAFLRVADAKEDNDPQLKAWANQVREITYDTEDILQEYILRITYPRVGGFLGNLRARRQTATEIQTLKLRIENVSKSQQRYRDMYSFMDKGSSSISPTTGWRRFFRGDAHLLNEEEVVGIDKPKKQLLEWLLPGDDGVKVISVVGMGGLGKTTLVKKVYDEASMKARFDHLAWVTVSESFKVEYLLKSILKQLLESKNQPSQNAEAMNLDRMKECVYKLLQNTTYIIVLDDIWNVDAWDSIRYAFPRSCSRGFIIITTRFSSIGNAACSGTNGLVYNLELLNAEDSEKLFYKTAFPGNSCPFYLKDVSKRILKRCQGLPLSIVVIGGLLATKNNNPEEWQIFERSIVHELQGDNLKGMMNLLSLSYYDLPYYLKACFLYLSIFPEDEQLEKWRIIRLWIAEGFVQSKQGKTEEEVGEGYLMELVNRNLIQVAETYTDGRPRKFRIHDILREFIISKAREYNFFASGNEEIKWPGKIRRLAIHSTSNYTEGSHNIKFLRSLFFFEFQDSKSGEMLNRVLRGGCWLLKVLDVRGEGVDMGKVMRSRGTPVVDSIPSEVFNLYCLKYLSLRGTNIKIIPKSIENLQHLETLDLKKSRVSGLPVEILKLRKLHHLLVESLHTEPNTPVFSVTRGFKAPPEIGSHLRNLQKLSLMDADESGGVNAVRELRKLVQLRKLGITKLRREDGMDLCSSLTELTNLRSLSIFSLVDSELMDLDHPLSTFGLPVLRKVLLHGLLRRLPQWVHSLHGLTKLHLEWSRLREDPWQSLGMLPNLVHLKMWFFAYEGERLTALNCSGGFPKLKELFIGELMGLRWVIVEKGSMPRLEELRVRNCTSLEELPVGIEHLSNLKYVELVCMSGDFIGRLAHKKSIGGEEWKLAHVTKVRVMFFGAGQLQMWNWYKD